jgi:2-iminoacetate synthase ThiH
MFIEKQRSPARITQYADYIRKAVWFCEDNGFYNDTATSILAEHYKNNISTSSAVRELAKITGLNDIETKMSFLLYKPRLELHPINTCNFHCSYCAWYENYDIEKNKNSYISFAKIDTIKLFNPKAILLSGGYCEPTLYYDKEHHADINNLIIEALKFQNRC